MIKKIVWLSAALFFIAITFIFSGCIAKQKKVDQIRSVELQRTFGKQTKNELGAISTKPNLLEPNSFNIFMVLVMCLFALLIGTVLGSYCNKRQLALPTAFIESFFMPHERRECTRRLCQDLQNAIAKISIASYWFTHLDIIAALKQARKKNISIEVIFDKSTPNTATLQQQFKSAGIKFTGSDINAARMHHKFIVIDDAITWVGSANLTGTAFRKNYENMMRIQSQEIAQRYLFDFNKLIRELGQSDVFKQKKQQTIRSVGHQSNLHRRSGKAISDYQKRVLNDLGIDWLKLNYDEAYAMIGRAANSTRRLLEYGKIKK